MLFEDDFVRDESAGAVSANYDVSLDGDSFMMIERQGSASSQQTITVVLNWLEELTAPSTNMTPGMAHRRNVSRWKRSTTRHEVTNSDHQAKHCQRAHHHHHHAPCDNLHVPPSSLPGHFALTSF